MIEFILRMKQINWSTFQEFRNCRKLQDAKRPLIAKVQRDPVVAKGRSNKEFVEVRNRRKSKPTALHRDDEPSKIQVKIRK